MCVNIILADSVLVNCLDLCGTTGVQGNSDSGESSYSLLFRGVWFVIKHKDSNMNGMWNVHFIKNTTVELTLYYLTLFYNADGPIKQLHGHIGHEVKTLFTRAPGVA